LGAQFWDPKAGHGLIIDLGWISMGRPNPGKVNEIRTEMWVGKQLQITACRQATSNLGTDGS
jgi:hypothetical protein